MPEVRTISKHQLKTSKKKYSLSKLFRQLNLIVKSLTLIVGLTAVALAIIEEVRNIEKRNSGDSSR